MSVTLYADTPVGGRHGVYSKCDTNIVREFDSKSAIYTDNGDVMNVKWRCKDAVVGFPRYVCARRNYETQLVCNYVESNKKKKTVFIFFESRARCFYNLVRPGGETGKSSSRPTERILVPRNSFLKITQLYFYKFD